MKGKYTKETAERIVEFVKADTYTVAEICRVVGINPKTYYHWINTRPDFAQSIEDARNELMDTLTLEARKSLLKKVRGYDVEEKKVKTVPGKKKGKDGKPLPVIAEQTITKKHIEPDTGAIIFVLTNGEPDRWKNRRNAELTGKDGEPLVKPARILTKKEAKEFMKQLEDDC